MLFQGYSKAHTALSHLKNPRSSSAAELDQQVDFVVSLLDLKHPLFPLGGPQFTRPEADADSAAAGHPGHCDGHQGQDPPRNTDKRCCCYYKMYSM